MIRAGALITPSGRPYSCGRALNPEFLLSFPTQRHGGTEVLSREKKASVSLYLCVLFDFPTQRHGGTEVLSREKKASVPLYLCVDIIYRPHPQPLPLKGGESGRPVYSIFIANGLHALILKNANGLHTLILRKTHYEEGTS